MFLNGSLNHKINRLHERCIRVIYSDSRWSYDELLNLDNSVSIHHRNFSNRNVQGTHWSATYILNEVFPLKPTSNYNLRNQQEFTIRPIKTTLCIEFFGIFRAQNN